MVDLALGCAASALALLGYAYFGYPLLLACLPPRRRPRIPLAAYPSVTLIVPAHDEEAVLRRKLENALALEYPGPLEILVASDGSTDATARIAAEFASSGVRLLDFPQRRGKASILNDAADVASGEVLCLCDANVYFHADAVRILVERLHEPGVGAVTGEVRLASEESNFGRGESLYYRIERRIQRAESDWGSLMGVDGGMYVLRASSWRRLPADTILDDFSTSMNVIQSGLRVVYEPDAKADENGTPTGGQEFRRRVRLGMGAYQALRRGFLPSWRKPVERMQFVSHKLLRWIGPFLLSALVLSSFGGSFACGFSLAFPQGAFLAALSGGLSAGMLLAAAAAFSLRLRATRLGGVAYYFALSQVALGWGMLKAACTNSPAAWQRTPRGAASVPPPHAAASGPSVMKNAVS